MIIVNIDNIQTTTMKKFLLLLFFMPTILLSQNKLGKAKEKLKEKPKYTTNKETKSSNSSDDSSLGEFGRSLIVSLFGDLIFKPIIYGTIGYFEERDLNPYPYYYKGEGEYAKELSDTGRKQNIRIGTNYIFSNIDVVELNVVYKPSPLLGINASYTHFYEKSRIDSDALDVTSLLFNYHRIREKNITIWAGLGATYVGNEVNEFGFSYNLGTEIYPFKPVSLHFSWQESYINEAEIQVFKSQLKYHIKNKAFFMGYQADRIAGESIKGLSVGFEIIF